MGVNPDTPTNRDRRLPDVVADQIRAHIKARGLVPGDRLGREADLAATFGISRPTLREGLRLLAASQMIRATKGPGGGIFVADPPADGIARTVGEVVTAMLDSGSVDLDELIETRLLLEVPLAGLAAQRASDADIRALDGLVAECRTDPTRLEEVDARLHAMIAGIAGNRVAGTLASSVLAVAQPQLATLIAGVVVEEVVLDQHRTLAQAISRGDPVRAERAMRDHLTYLRDVVAVVLREGRLER